MALTTTDDKETNAITGHWELKGVDGRGHPSYPLKYPGRQFSSLDVTVPPISGSNLPHSAENN
jgi:hypothetical protein